MAGDMKSSYTALAVVVLPFLLLKPLAACQIVGGILIGVAVVKAYAFASELNRCSRILSALPSPKYSFVQGLLPVFKSPHGHRLLKEIHEELGGVWHGRLLSQHFVFISDPGILAEVMSRTTDFDKNPNKNTGVDALTSDKGYHNLVSASTKDPRWRAVRKGLAPSFSPANLRDGFQHIVAGAERIATFLSRKGPAEAVDMDGIMLRQSMDVIGWVGFDQDMGSTKALFGREGGTRRDEFTDNVHCLTLATDEIRKRVFDPLRKKKFWRKDVKEGQAHIRNFQALMARLLASMRCQAGGLNPNSIAGHLLALKDPLTGQLLPDDRLIPEIGIFFGAGLDTSGHTAAWTLSLVAQHPEVEAKICEELDALGLLATPARPNPRAPVHEDLGKLTYVSHCIKESMRMLPVAPLAARKASGDMVLGQGSGRPIRIPAGTVVILNLYAMQNASANWQDPDAFRPERWAEPGADYIPAGSREGSGAAALKHNDEDAGLLVGDDAGPTSHKRPKRFLPFLEGPRSCIGQALARTILTASLALLWSRLHFELAPEMGGPAGVRAREKMALLLVPEGGMMMTCRPRVAAT